MDIFDLPDSTSLSTSSSIDKLMLPSEPCPSPSVSANCSDLKACALSSLACCAASSLASSAFFAWYAAPAADITAVAVTAQIGFSLLCLCKIRLYAPFL